MITLGSSVHQNAVGETYSLQVVAAAVTAANTTNTTTAMLMNILTLLFLIEWNIQDR